MSETNPSRVILFDNDDPAMQRAYEQARETFRFFWREIHWERRRIIPALMVEAVKAPFSDGAKGVRRKDVPEVEHMWMTEIDFDGELVSGTLMNSPNWLTTVQEGDAVSVPVKTISDWLYAYASDHAVYGAFTVNLLRSRMGKQELATHDEACVGCVWCFCEIRVAPKSETPEHPMSENAAPAIEEQLAEEPSLISSSDEQGWTALHREALAGNAAVVKVLLDAGADPNAVTDTGKTPVQLAQAMGWDRVVQLLSRR